MCADLLQQARLAAELNLECIRALSGTAADLDKPEYQRLKGQLAAFRLANPQCRFVYLMGRKADGVVFFFVDSEPASSKDYSPPGQVYDEAPEGCRRVFATRTRTVAGPYTDRWGKWVSALVPIFDPQTVIDGMATADEAHAMALRAVDFYRKNGREQLLKEINNPQGQFHKSDLYAFVFDRNMTYLAHPVNPERIGQNWIDRKDWAGGKYYRREIQEVARSKGHGWVEYEIENFSTGQLDHKTTYVEAVDDLIVCSGAYRGDGRILAVLGMDIDARDWKWMLARAALPPALLALALAAILLTGSALLARRSRLAGAAPHWMRHLEPTLAVAVGGALTLFAAWMAHDGETHDCDKAFAQLGASRTAAIADTLHEVRDTELEALARFCEHGDVVIPDEFWTFVPCLTKNPTVQAWAWIPAVPAADKARFEEQARAAGLTGFEIWQKDAQGNRIPASGRAVYYPIFLAAPLAANKRALGYDVGSEPARRAAMETAARTGLPTGTDPVAMVHEMGTQKAMVVCRAVFGSADPNRPRGFAVAVLRMGTLLRSAASDNSMPMHLSLLRQDAAPESLAASWGADAPPKTRLSVTRPVFTFGRVFAVTAYAGPEFISLYPLREGWLAALTGMVLTTAIAMVINVVLRRAKGWSNW